MNVLEEAQNIVGGDRQKDYGSPQVNFQKIATMWSALLGIEITPRKVAIMMVAFKLARLSHSTDHRDSYVDGGGYLFIAADMLE